MTKDCVIAEFGKAMPITGAYQPVRIGKTFTGYFDTAADIGGKKYYDGNMIGSIRDKNVPNHIPVDLYGRWDKTPYTVTLNRNG